MYRGGASDYRRLNEGAATRLIVVVFGVVKMEVCCVRAGVI